MNKLLRIDNIMYRVSDLKKAENFYMNVLGLKKVWEDKNARIVGFIFGENNSEIVVHDNQDMPKFDYSYLVEDVILFCEEFKKLGYKIILDPVEARSGNYAVIADPDGNEIPIIDLTKFDGEAKYD